MRHHSGQTLPIRLQVTKTPGGETVQNDFKIDAVTLANCCALPDTSSAHPNAKYLQWYLLSAHLRPARDAVAGHRIEEKQHR
jgi:hypothetical protein